MDVFHDAAEECRESYVKASRFWTLVFWGGAVLMALGLYVWWLVETGGAR